MLSGNKMSSYADYRFESLLRHKNDRATARSWLLSTAIGSYALLLLLLKKVSSARLGESDIHPISPKTPAPQYQPIDRKKRKGKRVEDYGRDRAA